MHVLLLGIYAEEVYMEPADRKELNLGAGPLSFAANCGHFSHVRASLYVLAASECSSDLITLPIRVGRRSTRSKVTYS